MDALVEKVEKDPYILAAIVGGSFSYAQVWEKSDLDVELIGRDAIRPTQPFFSLVENGVNIHARITPRNTFKQSIESAQQGSFMHSYFSHSTLLFSRDPSIEEWYDKMRAATTLETAINSSKSLTSLPLRYRVFYTLKSSFTSIKIASPLFYRFWMPCKD